MNKLLRLPASMQDRLLVNLFQHTTDSCVVTDSERVIVSANPEMLFRTGYAIEELRGKKDSVLFPKERRASYTSHVFKQLEKAGTWSGALTLVSKSGDELRVHATVNAIVDANEKITGTMILARYGAEQRASAQFVHTSEGLLQQLFNTMQDAVLLMDRSGKILLSNESFCRMFGWAGKECLDYQTGVIWLEKAEQKRLHHALAIAETEGSLLNVHLTGKRKDQSRIILSCTFSRFVHEASRQQGIIVTLRDVTNVHYSDELSKTHERLELVVAEAHRKTGMLDVLNEIHRLALKRASIERIFQTSVDGIKKILEYDLAGIYMYDSDKKKIFPHKLSKQTRFSKRLARFPLTLGEGIIGAAVAAGEMVLVNNAQNDPRSKYPPGMKPELEHFIAAPMITGKTLYGVLVVARNRNPEFIEEEAHLIKSFANATTLALEYARLLSAGHTSKQARGVTK
ncbi:MAG: PAS domain S-box protein [Bacteroidetes bacterium]|nr:MAG: PAS domain S-box protein [Bacteroidota bacterium]